MIALDTNVLVRALITDDPAQADAVRAFLEERTPQDPAYISELVLAETFWVLTRSAGLAKDAVLDAFAALARSPEICMAASVPGAIEAARNGADLPDALIDAMAARQGCRTVVSFDRRTARALGWTLLTHPTT